MQDPPPESDANGEEVSLQNILTAIQNHLQQTSRSLASPEFASSSLATSTYTCSDFPVFNFSTSRRIVSWLDSISICSWCIYSQRTFSDSLSYYILQQINESMERLSEKVDYMHQEQIEMETNQDTIRRDIEKLKTGKSLYVDVAREEEANSGEAREWDVMTQLLEMLKGQKNEDPVKRKYPTPKVK